MEVVRMICLLVAVILWVLATFGVTTATTEPTMWSRFNLMAAGLVAFGLAFLIPAIDALSD